MDIIKRLFSRSILINECILWTGAKYPNGYGCIKINGKTYGTHRVSYEIFYGEIPKGLLICHSCDVRNCINPAHLWIGTYKDNAIDAVEKGRQIPPINKGKDLVHGKEWAYVHRGCRCDVCIKGYKKSRHERYMRKRTTVLPYLYDERYQ